MTELEVLHFMKKIKAYYPTFSIEEYIKDEWYDRLKKYSVDDVYRKFDEHLIGEYKKEPPKLHFITRYLKAPNEKKEIGEYKVRCERCGDILLYINYDLHISRHNSVEYIKSNEKFLNLNMDSNLMMECDQEKFDEMYDAFIEKLYDKIQNSEEKKRLQNIIFSKAGMPIEIKNYDVTKKI